jgi:hypothetical protein
VRSLNSITTFITTVKLKKKKFKLAHQTRLKNALISENREAKREREKARMKEETNQLHDDMKREPPMISF